MRGHVGNRNPSLVKKFGSKRDATSKRFGSKSFTLADSMKTPAIKHGHSIEASPSMRGGPIRESVRAFGPKPGNTMSLQKHSNVDRKAFEDGGGNRGNLRHNQFKLSMNN
jgi:hypothetical protein